MFLGSADGTSSSSFQFKKTTSFLIPFTVLRFDIKCLFWIILFRIFRVVVYCLIIKVLVFAVWNSLFRLSYSLTFVKNFLNFFSISFSTDHRYLCFKHSFASATAYLEYHTQLYLSTVILFFFSGTIPEDFWLWSGVLCFSVISFRCLLLRLCYLTALSNATARLIYHKGVWIVNVVFIFSSI